jgi:hypothetical protein
MTESLNPAAAHHLPPFITAPGETDVLMVIMTFVLFGSVLMFGILFFRLHTLPERIAHKGQKLQFEIVAVLGLISLFTHMHIFWIIGLILALIEFPDFGTPLRQIAQSVTKIAGIGPNQETDGAGNSSVQSNDLSREQTRDTAAIKAELAQGAKKELGHV